MKFYIQSIQSGTKSIELSKSNETFILPLKNGQDVTGCTRIEPDLQDGVENVECKVSETR